MAAVVSGARISPRSSVVLIAARGTPSQRMSIRWSRLSPRPFGDVEIVEFREVVSYAYDDVP